MLATLGVRVDLGAVRARLKGGVTRFRFTLDAFEATYTGGRLKVLGFVAARRVRPGELPRFPLDVTARKLAALIAR